VRVPLVRDGQSRSAMGTPSGLDRIEPLLEAFLEPLYARKDTMHDWSHIRRITARAVELAQRLPCDSQLLRIAARLHGVVPEHEPTVRRLLIEHAVPKDAVDRIIEVALESDKAATPRTLVGKLLHDAHLLEGDENFLITKSLITGSARGQSLSETVAYLEDHLGAYQCYLPENQAEYERRVGIARTFLAKLKPEL
jgi:uncharacterized protein